MQWWSWFLAGIGVTLPLRVLWWSVEAYFANRAYDAAKRRASGELSFTEQSILEAAVRLRQQGFQEFSGFQVAKEMRNKRGKHFLVGYGTLYRALERLEDKGFLASRWEEVVPAEENRPRRKYYRLAGKAIR